MAKTNRLLGETPASESQPLSQSSIGYHVSIEPCEVADLLKTEHTIAL